MSYSDERTAIMTRWDTQWKLLHPMVPYAHGNARFNPPADNPWVRITILDGESRQASLGSISEAMFRHVGLIALDVYVPVGIGEALARSLMDDAAKIFRATDFSGILCREPRLSPGFATSNYYRLSSTISFQRDEVFT